MSSIKLEKPIAILRHSKKEQATTHTLLL